MLGLPTSPSPPQGFVAVEAAMPDHMAAEAAWLTGLTVEERDQLGRLLARVMESVGAESDGMPYRLFSTSARCSAVGNGMSENVVQELSMLEHLTPQEREALAATLARVVDTMVSC